LNESRCPGDVIIWQCSADRFILPGTTRPIDVNVFWGDEQALADFFGGKVTTPPDEGDEMDTTQLEKLISALKGIETAIKGITIPIPPTPDPDPDPDPEPEPEPGGMPAALKAAGYTGAYLGEYEVIDDPATNVSWMKLQDSWGSESTVLMNRMHDWLEYNCPNFNRLKVVREGVQPSVWKGDFWYITNKVFAGQRVWVAEIAGKPEPRARIIGFDSEGESHRGAKNLGEISVFKTPNFFHKTSTGSYPIVTPRHPRKDVLQAAWIPVKWLKKIG
jgi:hypothetical protein